MLSGNLYFQTVRSTAGKVEETLPFPSATTSKVVPFPLHLRANLFLFPAELRANLFPFPADLRARSTRFQNFQLWRLISFNWSPRWKKSIIYNVLVFAPSFTPLNFVFQYCSPLTFSLIFSHFKSFYTHSPIFSFIKTSLKNSSG